jgi:excisionase family DNA binding protein
MDAEGVYMSEKLVCESTDPVLSVEEVCDLLRIGRTTFYKLIHARKLAARKVRHRTVVVQDELARFIESLPRVGGDS